MRAIGYTHAFELAWRDPGISCCLFAGRSDTGTGSPLTRPSYKHTRPALTPRPLAALPAQSLRRVARPGSSRRRSGASPAAALLYGRHTSNNPVKYTDPDGHSICVDPHNCNIGYNEKLDITYLRTGTLRAGAESLVRDLTGYPPMTGDNETKLGGAVDIEVMKTIVGVGSRLYDGNDRLIPELSGIFLGNRDAIGNSATTSIERCRAVGTTCFINSSGEQVTRTNGFFGAEGFHEDFYAKGSNQVLHGWAYVASTAVNENARTTAGFVNYFTDRLFRRRDNVQHSADYALAFAGMALGDEVRENPPTSSGEWIDLIENHFGTQ